MSLSAKQKKIIDQLYKENMIQFGHFVLKSGVISPFYIDLRQIPSYPDLFKEVIGAFKNTLGKMQYKHIVGIPYAAIPFSTALGVSLNKPSAYTRKEQKGYAIDRLIEGNAKRGDKAIVVDDLITTAKSKIEIIDTLSQEGIVVKDVVVLVDRQQGGKEQLKSKGVNLHSVFDVKDIFSHLLNTKKISKSIYAESINFVDKHNVWVSASKKNNSLFELDRSIIVACDVTDIKTLRSLVKQTCDVRGIGGYKIGFTLGLSYGLPEVVKNIREFTDLPIIYDHQKAANDIPKMGGQFAQVCKNAGINSVILFPFTGPVSEADWIEACFEAGLHVMVGAHMTHDGFLETDGGSIEKDAPERIFTLASDMGVRDFVVPGNQPEMVLKYKLLLEELLGVGQFRLFAPGFVGQGGSVSETAKVAGRYWSAIVGSGIYQAPNFAKAAKELSSAII